MAEMDFELRAAQHEALAAQDRLTTELTEAIAASDAERALELADEVLRELDSSPIEAETKRRLVMYAVSNRATALGLSGRDDDAEAEYLRAIDLAAAIGEAERVERLVVFANHLTAIGSFNEALELLSETIATWPALAADARITQAKTWCMLGDERRTLEALEPFGERRLLATFLQWHEAQQAVEIGAQSEAQADRLRDGSLDDESLAADAELLRATEALHAESARVEAGVAEDMQRLDIINWRGRAFLGQGRYAEAEDQLRQVSEFWAGLAPRYVVDIYRARARLGLGDAAAAMTLAMDAVAGLGTEAPGARRVPDALVAAASALAEQDDDGAALALLDQVAEDGILPDAYWRVPAVRARLQARLERRREAAASFEIATRRIDELRRSPLGYRLDSTALEPKLSVFTEAILLAADLDDGEGCARLIERVKARALTTAIRAPRAEQRPDDPRWERLEALSRRADGLEFAADRHADWVDRRTAVLAERAALLEELRISDPRWRLLTEPPPFDPAELVGALRARSHAAISLYRGDGAIITVLADEAGFDVGRLDLDPATESAVARYIANIRSRRPAQQDYDTERFGLGLDDFVPGRLIERALQADSLIVVPHRELHAVPWAGLRVDDRRLFEAMSSAVVPTLGSITALRPPAPTPPSLCAFGVTDYGHHPEMDSLPGVAAELSATVARYGDVPQAVRENADATVAAFWDVATGDRQGGMLHIACHGDFDGSEPLASSLILSDGHIRAGDVRERHLVQDEVVLSACFTAYRATSVDGVELVGDDLIGLPGSFLEAGAGSVLVSIPYVNDAIGAAFIGHYHDARAGGRSPMAALRSAQLHMADRGSPVMSWIGFTLYGCH